MTTPLSPCIACFRGARLPIPWRMPARYRLLLALLACSALQSLSIAGVPDPDPPSRRHVAPSGYAGDVPPLLAYEWWRKGEAVLVDVRTDAERDWVGFVPGAVSLAWKVWPGMELNPAFDEGLLAGVPPGKKVLLLCRSGVRSVAAARRAAELGIEAYNILEGFEGDPDESAHRGLSGGWRFRGLPWRQR